MQLKTYLLILFTTCVFGVIQCAPKNVTGTEPDDNKDNKSQYDNKDGKSPYDISKFDTVYLQAQNGSENVRVHLGKIAVFLAPPTSLFAPLDVLAEALLGKDADDQKLQKSGDDNIEILNVQGETESRIEAQAPVKRNKKKSGFR